MNDKPRLIERAFCLKQASLDSVHEKNVRHGHISTLHIWPARRPLAASRAALVATLLPDPGTKEERDRILEKLGGRLTRTVKRKKLPGGRIDEKEAWETLGGILHWGRETSPELQWFRDEIRKAYGGRAPRVLDLFAGGGAIPLEAMRLGCEVTAIDINPVAWFILKCTLEYPQRLSGQHRPLPSFAVKSPEFMANFFKARGKATKTQLARDLEAVQFGLFPTPDVDLAWHVRAWGWWVLQRAKADLADLYPTIDGKPTVAYLWARTVTCKGCRATVPLLKTRWLCKTDEKRVLLSMRPKADRSGVDFGIESSVPKVGGNNAQRREHDRKIGAGTMSRSGAQCPSCPVIMTMEDIRLEGKGGRLSATMTAVVVDAPGGKDYRLPTSEELRVAGVEQRTIESLFADVPLGPPIEPINTGSIKKGGVSITRWGIERWAEVFTKRQLLALGTFLKHTRTAHAEMLAAGYSLEWAEATSCYLASMLDRLANQSSSVARWNSRGEKVEGTYARFALPLIWDYAELNPLGDTTGGYTSALAWVSLAAAHLLDAATGTPKPTVLCHSALKTRVSDIDVVLTDPPYYDAIPYSDLMDFFYVWLRRTLSALSTDFAAVLHAQLAPKWDSEASDGELIEDESRFGGSSEQAKQAYEQGMALAFSACHRALRPDGRLVIVFANKKPDAWETLVGAIIQAGFVVDGSWPIQTERGTRTRALTSAALSSSVWLVCRKRSRDARPGWDNRVLDEMRSNIYARLREFWDAGIHGPDFVWAATGPALEAYSKHPLVKKANDPGQMMAVSEFLREVRRIVVEFAVGQMLSADGEAVVGGLDDATIYYLLHRNDFGFGDAPAGAAILYAQACSLSDGDLIDRDILVRTGGSQADEDEGNTDEGEDAEEVREGTGSTLRLRRFTDRRSRSLGVDVDGRLPPLIDQLHKLMHLWRGGDLNKVNDYIDGRGLRRHPRFRQLVQSVIEMARKQQETDECSLLESISNHVAARGVEPIPQPTLPGFNVRPAADER